jgi:hypothetical protein
MSTTTTPKVVFFGATGGCANSVLVHTLQAGYQAICLARTPDKLRKQLTDQGLAPSMLDSQLTIVPGNATDVATVKKTITANGFPTHVVNGIGGAPKWFTNGSLMTIDNAHVCEESAQALLAAMREVYQENPALESQKPVITFISTTGITDGPEDVPYALRFLYHKLLATPHIDKKNMENAYRGDVKSERSVFRNFVGIRPTLLSGKADYRDAAGLAKVQSGFENAPKLGYSVKRADVGHWIFENVISEKSRKADVEGQMVSLTS